MSWFSNPAWHDINGKYSHNVAVRRCKKLGVEMLKMNQRQHELHHIFNLLNRRRIDLRPLQKLDIIEECENVINPDIALMIIESVDSYWLGEQAEKIRKRNDS